ncbi:unnamed protein product, partial [Ranitomeya imitator]
VSPRICSLQLLLLTWLLCRQLTRSVHVSAYGSDDAGCTHDFLSSHGLLPHWNRVYPPGSTLLVEGGYDAGARFGAGSSASVPPPPPGCPPNAAQLAAMQGANVIVTHREEATTSWGAQMEVTPC